MRCSPIPRPLPGTGAMTAPDKTMLCTPEELTSQSQNRPCSNAQAPSHPFFTKLFQVFCRPMLLSTAAKDKQKEGGRAEAGELLEHQRAAARALCSQVELREKSLIHNLCSALLLCSNENRGILVALAAK